MIIPGNTLLALLSPPQESQSTREEEGGFGALLTEIEQHTTSLPDQEEAERRALDSVLQVLMSIFQACTPANCLPAASAPGTGESDLVSMRSVGGLPPGLSPGRGTTPALGETGEVNLPCRMVSDGAQDMRQLAFPALDGQSTGASPAAAGAPENFSWLLHRQESMQDLSGLFMTQPTVALSVSAPTVELGTPSGAPLTTTTPSVSRDSVLATAEAQLGSPELLQTSLATTGEGHGAVQETLLQSLRLLSVQTSVGNQEPRDGLSGSLRPLPLGEGRGELVSQIVSTNTPPLVGSAPAAPWAVPATAPLTEAVVPLPTVPPTEVAALSAALRSGALALEDAALPESDPWPAPRPLPKSQERAAATVPSVAPLATDSGLPLASVRATSHIPSAEPTTGVPLSSSLEDMGHPWPRPVPANAVVLHLEPRELGALLLQVRVHDKHLIASFQAQSPEAETLLRTHLPSLHESLSQHGFEVQPIAISLAAEGFNAHMGAGTGAFAHQHSAFQAFAQDQQAASAREMQNEVELHKTPRRPTEQRPRLLDVVI
jgi:flagellar hook-length control protein FliK